MAKAMESEYKKIRRELAMREKDQISIKADDKIRNSISSRRYVMFTNVLTTSCHGNRKTVPSSIFLMADDVLFCSVTRATTKAS